MIAVSDTSPLSYLVLLGEGDLLAALFQKVWIPATVATELSNPGSPQAVRSWLAAPPAWLQVAESPDTGALPAALHLHGGEKEVVALALEINPDFVLLDDRPARKVAQDLGLSIMGTLAVLKVGAQRGQVDLPTALSRLAKTNFRASPELLKHLLE